MSVHKHLFLFKPGTWIGEGSVTLDPPPGIMHFTTTWTVGPAENQTIPCEHKVEQHETGAIVENHYIFYTKGDTSFEVELENRFLGKVKGKGILKDKTISWEIFRENQVQGKEIYELQENGDYTFHAEFSSPDQFKTIINGRIHQIEQD